MTLACKEHVEDIGIAGLTGHIGSDKSTSLERMQRHGIVGAINAENLAYGSASAQDVLIKFIIDDGNPTRSNRYNLMNPAHKFTGQFSG